MYLTTSFLVWLSGRSSNRRENRQLKLYCRLISGTGMSVGEVADAANRIVNERVKEPYTEQARAFYRQQLLAAVPK
jgi:hypothetical protein